VAERAEEYRCCCRTSSEDWTCDRSLLLQFCSDMGRW